MPHNKRERERAPPLNTSRKIHWKPLMSSLSSSSAVARTLSWGGAGTIYGWGHNHRGQLGGVDGAKVSRHVSVTISNLELECLACISHHQLSCMFIELFLLCSHRPIVFLCSFCQNIKHFSIVRSPYSQNSNLLPILGEATHAMRVTVGTAARAARGRRADALRRHRRRKGT